MDGNREFAVSETFSGLDGDGTWVGGPGLVGSLWRYRLVIVAVTALAAIAGYAVSLLLPAQYEAQASLYLRDPGSPAVLTLGGSVPPVGRPRRLHGHPGRARRLRRGVRAGAADPQAQRDTRRRQALGGGGALSRPRVPHDPCHLGRPGRGREPGQRGRHRLPAGGRRAHSRGVRRPRSRGCGRSGPSWRPSSTPSERSSRRRAVPIRPPSSARRCTWPI